MGIIGYGYGSEWHLTQWLARRRSTLTERVERRLGLRDLRWLDHQEYLDRKTGQLSLSERRGLDFLQKDDPIRQEWEQMWPQTGNVHNWDAVGHTDAGGASTWVLVEAKAHIAELASSCGAVSDDSRRRIADVLAQARHALEADGASDWLSGYYQYCNRIALLHFLRERRVDAHLLFIYFTGDRADLGSPGRDCPDAEAGWRSALDEERRCVGIPASAPILQFVHELFLATFHLAVNSSLSHRS